MKIAGKTEASFRIKEIALYTALHETFDVAVDWGSAVSNEYLPRVRAPDGLVKKLVVEIRPPAQ